MFGRETPTTILEWNKETFGSTVNQIANRTLLEIAELYHAALSEDKGGMLEELADVAIMVWAVAAGNDIDVDLNPLTVISSRLFLENHKCSFDSDKMRLTKLYTNLVSSYYVSYLGSIDDEIASAGRLINVLSYINAIAYIWDIRLPNIVDAKMSINRSRKWEKVGKDNFQHV